jgi:multiple sugar transport system ATP-binding protein
MILARVWQQQCCSRDIGGNVAAISFSGVTKRYGDVEVIRNLDLDIKSGEFMVFVGPSGCGKSTALRMIAGLETISEGTLSIGDRVVNDLAPKERDVAMVFQSYALYPHMSVRDNIAFGLKVRKMDPKEIDARVSEAARILDLGNYLDRKPKALSGGQRQRVALGRAIVRQPSVFLFDEPLSNLDAKLRTGMRAEISRLQRKSNTTAVYVTHDQVEAMTMGDRIAVLAPLAEAGHSNLMQCGTPLELYERPQNLFVARFIGAPSMAILEVTRDGTLMNHPAFNAPAAIDARWVLDHAPPRLTAGVRPEDVRPQADGGMPFSNHATATGTVEMLETLGHEVLIYLDVGGQTLIAKSFSQHVMPSLGETITVDINLAKLHLFDPDSQARLPERS